MTNTKQPAPHNQQSNQRPARLSLPCMLLCPAAAASVLLTLGLSKVVQQQGGATNSVVLFALVGCLEAVRGGCMLLLARRYPRENLSAP
jgi:hypothetical protein